MTETVSIGAFLEARYAEAEADALAASHGDDQLDPAPGGEHWHWVYAPPGGRPSDGISDRPVDLARDRDYVSDQLGYVVAVSLRSVEEYPTASVGPLPRFLIHHAEEIDVSAARHIARHDPARVLAHVAAMRSVLAVVERWPHDYVDGDTWFSCAQAIEPGSTTPGSGCADENRAGTSCDCSRDARARNVLSALAAEFSDHPDHHSGWGIPGAVSDTPPRDQETRW